MPDPKDQGGRGIVAIAPSAFALRRKHLPRPTPGEETQNLVSPILASFALPPTGGPRLRAGLSSYGSLLDQPLIG